VTKLIQLSILLFRKRYYWEDFNYVLGLFPSFLFNANNQLSSTGQSTLHGNNIHVRGHGVGSNQFLSVNIGVIRLLSVITTTPSNKNNVSLINTGPTFRH
jgi:hypothetical protein